MNKINSFRFNTVNLTAVKKCIAAKGIRLFVNLNTKKLWHVCIYIFLWT